MNLNTIFAMLMRMVLQTLMRKGIGQAMKLGARPRAAAPPPGPGGTAVASSAAEAEQAKAAKVAAARARQAMRLTKLGR